MDKSRDVAVPYVQDLFSWLGVGWIIAIFLGLWGAMIGIGKFAISDLFLAISGLIVVSKILVDALHTKTVTRWICLGVAALLICSAEYGVFHWTEGLFSEARTQQERLQQLDVLPGLLAKVANLQTTVDTYGPKLQAIVDHPESPEQKALALLLLNKLKPKIQIDDPHLNGTRPSISFLANETNVGDSIAKGQSSTANIQIDTQSSQSETRLFSYLYSHEDDPDIKPQDMNPGYAARAQALILSRPPLTAERIMQMRSNEVVYIGVLSTFYDESGREYHTEKCMFFDKDPEHLNQFCSGHNLTY
jgi:hypothetical protein